MKTYNEFLQDIIHDDFLYEITGSESPEERAAQAYADQQVNKVLSKAIAEIDRSFDDTRHIVAIKELLEFIKIKQP